MEILVVVFSWLLFGGASSYFAGQRGRDPFAWFLIGMLLGILGLLLLFLLPPLNKEEEASPVEIPKEEAEDSSYRLKSWYYLDENNEQVGPASFNQLKKAGQAGKIRQDTLLWCEGMKQWTPMADLPMIREALQ